jgi:hypothetical protein
MIRKYPIALAALLSANPAMAQHADHDMAGMTMPMTMPMPAAPAKPKPKAAAKPKAKPKPAPAKAAPPASHAGHDMAGMTMPAPAQAEPGAAPSPPAAHDMAGMATPAPAATPPPADDPHAGHDMAGMAAVPPADDHAGHDMAQMDHSSMAGMGHAMTMKGLLGSYAMNREGSGTAWQPESAPMQGSHIMSDGWQGMVSGSATFLYDKQGGPRGDDKVFSESMLMVMGGKDFGRGRLGLRAMVSLDPLMGKSGYPLLFATGETANGRTELIDRQHPHDFLMEVAASWAQDLGGGKGLYLYAGLPGEPALGPPTFMHRLSGMDNPEAPIGHHWFDSTHVTFGVVTAGFSTRTWKIEASAFKGREPDQHRWDVETPKLDSWSVRAFWNPTANLSFQASTGHLHSPEQLHPDENEQRTTVSASYNLPLAHNGNWATTIAWSLKDHKPGEALHGWLAETSLRLRDHHMIFARAEHVEEAELFATGPLHHDVIPVSKLSIGYAYELPLGTGPVRVALGGLASAYAYPERIEPDYGKDGVKSFMLFARFRLAGASAH